MSASFQKFDPIELKLFAQQAKMEYTKLEQLNKGKKSQIMQGMQLKNSLVCLLQQLFDIARIEQNSEILIEAINSKCPKILNSLSINTIQSYGNQKELNIELQPIEKNQDDYEESEDDERIINTSDLDITDQQLEEQNNDDKIEAHAIRRKTVQPEVQHSSLRYSNANSTGNFSNKNDDQSMNESDLLISPEQFNDQQSYGGSMMLNTPKSQLVHAVRPDQKSKIIIPDTPQNTSEIIENDQASNTSFSLRNDNQMIEKAEAILKKGKQHLRRHSNNVGFANQEDDDFDDNATDFQSYLANLSKNIDKRKDQVQQSIKVQNMHLRQQMENQRQIAIHKEEISINFQEIDRLTKANDHLSQQLMNILQPVIGSMALTWDRIERLKSHNCNEKQFQAAFTVDKRLLGDKVYECRQKLALFKYTPIPPVPEGVTRTYMKVKADEHGNHYEGEINTETQQRDGRGHMMYADGSYYEGYWRSDEASGRGRKIFIDGDYYEGEFQQGKATGYGRKMASDQYLYEGYWKDDLYHGKGKLVYNTGIYVEGYFVEGQIHGKGIQMWNDGKRYLGEFSQGKCHGKGKCMYTDGSYYDGDWENDQRNGEGEFNDGQGKTQKGMWKDNKYLGASPKKVQDFVSPPKDTVLRSKTVVQKKQPTSSAKPVQKKPQTTSATKKPQAVPAQSSTQSQSTNQSTENKS